jgi:hypothetical protein
LSRLSCILPALFLFATLTALNACSTTLATRAPNGIDLSGEWQIDLALSDFPQQSQTLPLPVTGTPDATVDSGGGQGGGRGGRARTAGGSGPGIVAPGGMAGGAGRFGQPEVRFARPPHLSISQSANELTIDITMPDGKHLIHHYVSGERSIVPTTRGAANRTLGWDGGAYLIRTIVGEKGPQSDVRYSLERDGALSVTATFSDSGRYDYQYTLVYDRIRP